MAVVYKKIMVALAGSKFDQEVVQLGVELAKKRKAQLFALHIIEVPQALPLDADLPQAMQRGEKILEMAEQWATEMEYKIDADLLQARSAGAAITDESIERNVDLVIMAVPYRKKFGDFYLGSTVSYVLKHAPCRTWVCREPME
jgi:basic amino acid/polyamine antiporter, APA family